MLHTGTSTSAFRYVLSNTPPLHFRFHQVSSSNYFIYMHIFLIYYISKAIVQRCPSLKTTVHGSASLTGVLLFSAKTCSCAPLSTVLTRNHQGQMPDLYKVGCISRQEASLLLSISKLKGNRKKIRGFCCLESIL